jgi:hypothetical protein
MAEQSVERRLVAGEWETVIREADGGGTGYEIADVTLTDAQIKALPTTSIQVVEPIETPDYNSTVTSLPIIVRAIAVLDAVDQYASIDDPSALQLCVGAHDWIQAEESQTSGGHLFSENVATLMVWRNLPQGNLSDTTVFRHNLGLHDNGIVLASDNSVDFTDGDPANTLRVIIHYFWLDV